MHTETTNRVIAVGSMVAGMVLLSFVSSPLIYLVHSSLVKFCYLPHAQRWCRKNGYKALHWKAFYTFAKSGIKTEYTAFELHCSDSSGKNCYVFLLAWVFGVKRVLNISESPISVLYPNRRTGFMKRKSANEAPSLKGEEPDQIVSLLEDIREA